MADVGAGEALSVDEHGVYRAVEVKGNLVAGLHKLHGEYGFAVEGGAVAEVEGDIVVLHIDSVGDLRLHGAAAQEHGEQSQYPLYSSHISVGFQNCKSTLFFRNK